jgi:hypothetical protein
MTNLEDAYLRATIHLADTLAEALIPVNEEKRKPLGTRAGHRIVNPEGTETAEERVKRRGGQVAVAKDPNPGSTAK